MRAIHGIVSPYPALRFLIIIGLLLLRISKTLDSLARPRLFLDKEFEYIYIYGKPVSSTFPGGYYTEYLECICMRVFIGGWGGGYCATPLYGLPCWDL